MRFGETSFGGEGSDTFLAKLDPAGKPICARRFGDAVEQSAAAVKSDALGAIVLTGAFREGFDLGEVV